MSTTRDTAIVYGAFINPAADWRKLIRLQLCDLNRSGVLSIADLHVIVTNNTDTKGVEEFFQSLPVQIKFIEFHDQNRFEYPALLHAWNLANTNEQYLHIAYFHSKGMSYAKKRRDKNERALTRFTFVGWREVLKVFKENPEINKIGLCPEGRWIWFNFWWVRSSFIRKLPKPQDTPERHVHEVWLASLQSNEDCYSIYSGDRSSFTASEALSNIATLKRKLKYGPFYNIRMLLFPPKQIAKSP